MGSHPIHWDITLLSLLELFHFLKLHLKSR